MAAAVRLDPQAFLSSSDSDSEYEESTAGEASAWQVEGAESPGDMPLMMPDAADGDADLPAVSQDIAFQVPDAGRAVAGAGDEGAAVDGHGEAQHRGGVARVLLRRRERRRGNGTAEASPSRPLETLYHKNASGGTELQRPGRRPAPVPVAACGQAPQGVRCGAAPLVAACSCVRG